MYAIQTRNRDFLIPNEQENLGFIDLRFVSVHAEVIETYVIVLCSTHISTQFL